MSITIFVHGNCNFRCEYCYEKFNNRHINYDKEIKILEFVEQKIKEANFDRLFVSWFGGEPLLSFDTICSLSVKLKNLTNKYGIDYSADITTNAYFLTIDILLNF